MAPIVIIFIVFEWHKPEMVNFHTALLTNVINTVVNNLKFKTQKVKI